MSSSTSNWKPLRWARIDLLFMIYTSIPTWTHSQNSLSRRSTEFKDILPQNISQMITKTIPISTRIVISYAMKQGIPFWVWWKVNGNWDNNMIRIYKWRETIAEQILTPEEINKSTRAGLWDSQSGIQVERLTIWVRSFEILFNQFIRSISATRKG